MRLNFIPSVLILVAFSSNVDASLFSSKYDQNSIYHESACNAKTIIANIISYYDQEKDKLDQELLAEFQECKKGRCNKQKMKDIVKKIDNLKLDNFPIVVAQAVVLEEVGKKITTETLNTIEPESFSWDRFASYGLAFSFGGLCSVALKYYFN